MVRLNGVAMLAFFGFLFCQNSIAQQSERHDLKNSISLNYPIFHFFNNYKTTWLYTRKAGKRISDHPLLGRGRAFGLEYVRYLKEKGTIECALNYAHIYHYPLEHLRISSREFLSINIERGFGLVNGPDYFLRLTTGGTLLRGNEFLYLEVPNAIHTPSHSVSTASLGLNLGISAEYYLTKRIFIALDGRYTYFVYRSGHEKNSIYSQYLPTRYFLNTKLQVGFRF